MRRIVLAVVAAVALSPSAALGQNAQETAEYKALVARYRAARPSMSTAKRAELDRLVADLAAIYDAPRRVSPAQPASPVGRLTENRYLAPLSRYDPLSPANPYGEFGSKYSPTGARNNYTTDGLDIVGADGEYLGKLNSNRYDPNSVANPYGQYGSKYSPTSINNPYGAYGSKYSPLSARNPYASDPPRLYAPRSALLRSPLDSLYRRR